MGCKTGKGSGSERLRSERMRGPTSEGSVLDKAGAQLKLLRNEVHIWSRMDHPHLLQAPQVR